MSADTPARRVSGIGKSQAITDLGRTVSFEINTEDGATHGFSAHHAVLDRLTNDLRLLAEEARQRRAFGIAPEAAGLPMARKANPASKIDVSLDAAGKSALWRVSHEDGLVSEVQFSVQLLETLLGYLPKHIAELKSRQHQSDTPN